MLATIPGWFGGKAKLVERTLTYIYYYGLFFNFFHLLKRALGDASLEMEIVRVNWVDGPVVLRLDVELLGLAW